MTTKLAPGMYFGERGRGFEAGGLTFAESAYGAGLDIPEHGHTHAFFYLVVAGACDEVCRNARRFCGASTLVFHPAGELHANRWHEAGGRAFHVEIASARADALREYTTVLDRPADFRGGAATWLAGRLYREYRRPDGASPLAMEGLALELLAECSRHAEPVPDRKPPRWLVGVVAMLHDRFSENLSLDEIADEAGVHRVHLARTFRAHHGCTLGDYVRRLRIEAACRELADSNLPLVEVALSAGFSDQSHFSKAFRGAMRMTPGEFRRQHRTR